MNGMERLTDAAARHGWERQEEPRGWSRTVHYSRGNQRMEVYRRVDGGVTYATRTWGSRTSATAPKVADQVLTWMQEPTPDDGTDRGFFFRLATGHGWTFEGVSSGYVYRWGPRTGEGSFRITLRFGAAGALADAQRNFGGPGETRAFFTNVPANITPWFHAFLDEDAQVCGCTRNPLGHTRGEHPTEAAQEAVKPTIRPAMPQTPDRKLRGYLEALEADAHAIWVEMEGRRIRPAELEGDWAWGTDGLELLANRLEDLASKTRDAHRQALYLWAERRYNRETADMLKDLHRRQDARING